MEFVQTIQLIGWTSDVSKSEIPSYSKTLKSNTLFLVKITLIIMRKTHQNINLLKIFQHKQLSIINMCFLEQNKKF